ncbi:unannotated protein [freshwater metagenome]|uniref:Unannotated protein n=1 Tax=freshwater metagenome TaxID=449393 RepID=A0A6J7EE89_9ZZZZ
MVHLCIRDDGAGAAGGDVRVQQALIREQGVEIGIGRCENCAQVGRVVARKDAGGRLIAAEEAEVRGEHRRTEGARRIGVAHPGAHGDGPLSVAIDQRPCPPRVGEAMRLRHKNHGRRRGAHADGARRREVGDRIGVTQQEAGERPRGKLGQPGMLGHRCGDHELEFGGSGLAAQRFEDGPGAGRLGRDHDGAGARLHAHAAPCTRRTASSAARPSAGPGANGAPPRTAASRSLH